MSHERSRHWDGVYDDKPFTDVSWYQDCPEVSLRMIADAGLDSSDPLIDIGGGASMLVDHLLGQGYNDLTVLDVSESALAQARTRLGGRADRVRWEVVDVTRFDPPRTYRLWHDRAALHFLIDAADRDRYVDILRRALPPGGDLVLATFGPDGPLKCSGLDVRRYSVDRVAKLLGPDFELQSDELDLHETPRGGAQQFLFTHWRRRS